ncbi:MAG: permease [Acholeplasma sp.]|nr:permease [Acholeplasma sp.]
MIKDVFVFLNDLLLKMSWLNDGVEWVFKTIFKLDETSLFFKGITFFFYDVIKIFILLSFLIFISSYIQSYFSPERTRKILSKVNGFWANVIGALLGTVTPFCSCSSIPIFIGFTKAGLPIGVTFSFLISSPLVDLASILLLASIFGYKIALIYVVVGLLIAIVGGSLISLFKMERFVLDFVKPNESDVRIEDITEEVLTKKQRVTYAKQQVKEIVGKVWVYILLGVGIGALIHGYIPQSWIMTVLGSNNPFSVLLATLVGIPMYADIFGTLPIAEALVLKGVGIGTVLSFMMAVTALSLPSIIMIKKVVKKELLFMFVTIVTLSIIIMGYLFNTIGYLFI